MQQLSLERRYTYLAVWLTVKGCQPKPIALSILLLRQYGGSEAHSGVFQAERGDWATATRLREKLTSLRRAINNGFYDHEKQDALNLFLGHYVPAKGQPALWDLDSDHYLHTGTAPLLRMSNAPCEAVS